MKVTFEGKGDFSNAEAWLKDISTRSPSMALNQIAREGEGSLSSNTPKDTGATASGWKANVTSKGSISEVAWINTAHPGLNVSVAKLIDQGHGTRNGGYVQPRPYIKQAMDKIWKDAGDKIAKEMVK